MNITIHRGTDQIGGCVTEYEFKGWRLFVDYGEQLPGATIVDNSPEIEGLTSGDVSKSALLITHYHGDHTGKIANLPEDLPIFMGKVAKDILSEFAEHCGHASDEHRRIRERLETVSVFSPGKEFEFGKFRIMPVVIDHSAFDAYAFRIEAGGLKVFHTGDFRTHGFRSKTLPLVIEKYVGPVDYMVCEATNVNRPDAIAKPEYELQQEFVDAFHKTKYNVVYLSSTNVDRLFALYHAALKANLPFYVDAYQKKIMDTVAGRDHIWGKSKLYKYTDQEPIVLQRDGNEFRINDKFREYLTERGYVLIARANERFDKLISRMPSDGRKTYLSMWNGYVDETKAAYNTALANSLGKDYEYLHTSGHCDMASLENLISMLRPKAIIPIHTYNPRAFAELFCDKWPVLLLNDGETFSPIHNIGHDGIEAKIITGKQPANDIVVVENKDNLAWGAVGITCIGEFSYCEDAEFALRHVVYAPTRILAYKVMDIEDLSPYHCVVYGPDFTVLSEYRYGARAAKGKKHQETTGFRKGDLVYAVIYSGYNVIIPCEFIGPITKEYLRNFFEHDKFRIHDSFKEYLSQLEDSIWDSVIVRPLVRLSGGSREEIGEEIDVMETDLLPYNVVQNRLQLK